MHTILKELKKKSLLSRKGIVEQNKDINIADTVVNDTVIVSGKVLKRKRVSLNYKSCKVKVCSMCPFPNDGISTSIDDKYVFEQLNSSGCKKEKYDMLTLYHNGNFFADNEISPALRNKIYSYISNLDISHFVVESLPQTITEQKLQSFKDACPNIKLHVAMGVQTMDAFLRECAILSNFSENDLSNAINNLKAYGYIPRVFLMYGIPFLSNKESLQTVISDIKIIKEKYNIEENIVICPLVIMPNTLVNEISNKTGYKAPEIEDINDLILALSFYDLKPKITINSSVYEYTGDSFKREKYLRIKENLMLFNENMFSAKTTKIKMDKYNKDDVIRDIKSFLTIDK